MGNPSFEPLWLSIENYVRSYLPQQKLQERIWAGVTVTDLEARQEFLLRTEKVAVRYLDMGPESVREKPAAPTEEALHVRYEAKKDEFVRPPRARAEYVVLPKVPDEEDVKRAEQNLADIQADLAADVPFEDVAADYSDDVSSSRGGDIGWVSRGDMKDKALEDAIFALKEPDDVSPPVRDNRGFHLFQLVERDKDRAHVRQILVATRAGRRAVAALHEKAKKVIEQVTAKGLHDAARGAGLEPRSTDLFTQANPPQDFLGNPDALTFCFQSKTGAVGGPFDRGDALLVMQLAESLPAEPIPFEEAKSEIRTRVETEERQKMAADLANEVASTALKETDLSKVARQHSLMVKEAGPMTRYSPAPGLQGHDAVLGMCFALPTGETSPLVEDGGRFYVVQVKERSAPADSTYEQVPGAALQSGDRRPAFAVLHRRGGRGGRVHDR
jgi:peptidyl-prolyl cis-trans isomerase D